MIAKPNFSTGENKMSTLFCWIVFLKRNLFLIPVICKLGLCVWIVQKTKTATKYAWVCLINANKENESCVISHLDCSVPPQSRVWVLAAGSWFRKKVSTVPFPDQLVFLGMQKVGVTQLPESSSPLGGRKRHGSPLLFLSWRAENGFKHLSNNTNPQANV